jgi:hypothetical protein
MIVSHSRKFIFIHIHKTAGESVTHALAPFLARGDLVLGSTPIGEVRNAYYARRHSLKKHGLATTVRDAYGPRIWEDYFKFSFVRNPYDRARSLYFFYEKVAKRRQSASVINLQYLLPALATRDPLRWPGMTAYLETRSFSGFIRHPNFSTEKIATRTQFSILSDPDRTLMVDFVGRFENLAEDFRTVARRLRLPEATLDRHNASANSRRSAEPMAPEDRDLLYQLYRDDFDAFGYPR